MKPILVSFAGILLAAGCGLASEPGARADLPQTIGFLVVDGV